MADPMDEMMIFPDAPAPPTAPTCPAGPGAHDPIDLDPIRKVQVGKIVEQKFMLFRACRNCGLMYWEVSQ